MRSIASFTITLPGMLGGIAAKLGTATSESRVASKRRVKHDGVFHPVRNQNVDPVTGDVLGWGEWEDVVEVAGGMAPMTKADRQEAYDTVAKPGTANVEAFVSLAAFNAGASPTGKVYFVRAKDATDDYAALLRGMRKRGVVAVGTARFRKDWSPVRFALLPNGSLFGLRFAEEVNQTPPLDLDADAAKVDAVGSLIDLHTEDALPAAEDKGAEAVLTAAAGKVVTTLAAAEEPKGDILMANLAEAIQKAEAGK